MMLQECQNYICNTPPLWCVVGDLIFTLLIMILLIVLIYGVIQSIREKWNPLPTKVGSFQKTKENGKNKKRTRR